MSEHKTNPTAAIADTFPNLLPPGFRCGIDLQLQVVPKTNVMLAPPHRMRTADDGTVEVLVGDPEEWRKPPVGVDVCEMGKPLPPEKCDVVLIAGTMVEDTLGPKLLTQPGQHPRGKVSSSPLGIVARAPLDAWQKAHLGALRGPVE
jgi:hypothetical protein